MTFNNTNERWDQQEESLKTDKQKKNLSQINSLTFGSTTAKPFMYQPFLRVKRALAKVLAI